MALHVLKCKMDATPLLYTGYEGETTFSNKTPLVHMHKHLQLCAGIFIIEFSPKFNMKHIAH